MAGPKYYERFRGLCVEVIRRNRASINSSSTASACAKRRSGQGLRSAISKRCCGCSDELRAHQARHLYINQTTGTWPSPFWLMHADSIWRGGDDHGFAGIGSDRQRWITYRDGDVYQNGSSAARRFIRSIR